MRNYKEKLSDSCNKLEVEGIITKEQKDKCNEINSKFVDYEYNKKKIFGEPLRNNKLMEYNKFIKDVDTIIDQIITELPSKKEMKTYCDNNDKDSTVEKNDTIERLKTLDDLLVEMIKYVNDINYKKYYRNESKHNDEIKRNYVNMDIRRKKLDELNGKYDTLEQMEKNNISKLDNNNSIYLIILIFFIIVTICLIIYIIKFLK